jgi:tRNA threonylcarbamoyladenosine modification (KEOPS) complex  Pcc1 subunit
MNYEIDLKAFGDSKTLFECFKPEILKGDRAAVDLKKKKEYLLFKIKAKDSTALRAMMNSISKLLTVHEKIRRIS